MKKLKIIHLLKNLLLTLFFLFLINGLSFAINSPVEDYDIDLINNLLKKNSINNGYVDIDEWGRIELKGEYENEDEVDKAFAIAQSIVGVRWISRVTPDRIKVRVWEVEASNAFSRLAKRKKGFTAPGPVDNVYALIVGISFFQAGNNIIPPLPAAQRDAELVGSTLHSRLNVNPQKIKIFKFINEKATKHNILNAMSFIRENAKKDDMIFVYFATHGTPPDKDGFIRFITFDTNVTNLSTSKDDFNDVIWKTSISDKELYSFYENIEARRLINMFDVCYSGDSLKNVPGMMHAKSRSIFSKEITNQGLSSEVMKKKFIKSRDLFVEETRQTTSQQINNQKDWGQVFISATGEGQRSWENSNGNGIFTYHMTRSLVSHRGSIKNSFNISKPLIEKDVYALSREQQNPQLIQDSDYTNMVLPFK